MTLRRLAPLPAAVAALLGLLHPTGLTPESADRWVLLHLVLLPVFPLIGASVWWLLRDDRSLLAHLARLLAAGYAVLYSALDAIAGIGGGHQVRQAAERGDPRPPVNDLYEIGDALGHLGARLLLVALVLAALLTARRSSRPVVPLLALPLLVIGARLHDVHHLFPTRGVLGLALVSAGTALLAAPRLVSPSVDRAGLTAHTPD